MGKGISRISFGLSDGSGVDMELVSNGNFPPEKFVVPSTGRFGRFLHDFETAKNAPKWGGRPRSLVLNFKKNKPDCALPETVMMWGNKKTDFIPMNKKWQRFWFELIVRSVNGSVSWNPNGIPTVSGGNMSQGEIMSAWINLVADHRALTDRHAPDTPGKLFTDYVTGRNLDNPYGYGDMQIKTLQFGGNIAKIVGEDSKYYYIETLDMSSAPPSAESVWGKWWLVGFATQETVRRNSDGTYKVVHFPQMRNYGKKTGTPFPVVSRTGVNSVLKYRMEPISNSAEYSIVVPSN